MKKDSEKLRMIAEWFDLYDKKHSTNSVPEVQDFLRDLANRLDACEAKYAEELGIRGCYRE